MSFSFTNWLKSLKTNFIGTRRHHPRLGARPLRTTRLSVEWLEDRVTPAILTPTLLVSFDGANGANPVAGLVMDGSGNLFGTTQFGGASNLGTVFKIAAGTHEFTPLASFGGFIGAEPLAGLVTDGSGNLFGTAVLGGAFGGPIGYGTVFEVAAGSNAITPLAFFDGTNGSYPTGDLVVDGSGNLFGTSFGVGLFGQVFELAAGSGIIKNLVAFDGTNGADPGPLVIDGGGNLFGTTGNGGANGAGTVFEIAAGDHAFTTLASFDGKNGSSPTGLLLDGSGNLFGTAYWGGDSNLGTVFEVAAGSHTIMRLVSFNGTNGTNGANPDSGLVMDRAGNLFGTTLYSSDNGVGSGTVFEVAAGSHEFMTLAYFNGTNGANPDGAQPAGSLVMDGSGNLFGTTLRGGNSNLGTVFEIAGVGTPALLPTVTTVTDAGGTYDGVTAFAATVTVTGAGTITGSPTLDYIDNTTATDMHGTAPINAGNYTVTATYAGDATHTGSTGSATFDILKANATISVSGYSVTYNGAAHTATGSATGVGGEDLSALLNLSGTTHTNAGSYTDSWSFAGSDNYNAATGTVADSITAASLDGFASAITQAALNVSKAGTVTFALSISGGIVDGQTIAQLFDGATFTLQMRTSADASTYESIQVTSTATVVNNVVYITLNLKNNTVIDNFFLQGVDSGETSAAKANWEDITMSALSKDNNYTISDDVLMRIFSSAK